jgi:formylglycine-generating enzyme required for sulfatase activity
LIFIAQNSYSQNTKKYELPEFVQINDSLFVAKFEVSIRDYAAFLLYAKQILKDSLFAEKCLPNPNTTDWIIWNSYKKEASTLDNTVYTFRDSTVSFNTIMRNLPITNISTIQALAYCIFKNDDYKEFLIQAKKKQKKRLPPNLFFRLLTEKEWNYAASFSTDTSNIICTNYFTNNSLKESRPMPVYNGTRNSIGLFNMVGNVAELVSDNEEAMGGSFKDSLKACNSRIQKDKIRIEHTVGFRIAAVIR